MAAAADEAVCREQEQARRAWHFEDLGVYLGATRDVVSASHTGTRIGFNIAETVTSVGFGMTRGSLNAVGRAGPYFGMPALKGLMEGTDKIVGIAETLTAKGQSIAKDVTLQALSSTQDGLDAMGAQKNVLLTKIIGQDQAEACVAIARAAEKVSAASCGLGRHPTNEALYAAFASYLGDQTGAPSPEGKESVDPSFLLRWMGFSSSVFPLISSRVLGMFRNYSGPSEDFMTTFAANERVCLVLDAATNPPSEMYCPAHAFFVDDANKVAILSIRGTNNIADTLTDLVCEPRRLEDGELPCFSHLQDVHVHSGMFRAATNLRERLTGLVEDVLAERPEHELVITGHSLGAGVAALLTLQWKPLFGNRLRCVTFGPPQTLSLEAARAAEAQGVTSVISGDDAVPRLSLHTVSDLFRHAATTSSASPSCTQLALAGQPFDPPDHEVPELRPAGRLIYLPEDGSRRAWVEQQETFKFLRLSNRMLLAHLPNNYLKAVGGQNSPYG
eukprot:TRINITY_DN7599_c0_g1_i1.p1 TRINITY_DN7599_c0_g1~~TRINITY_DN7599_c0_g1_i1.p1  ORF type:complete len:529 (-),score=59.75 TRINITY_DN7599_c0_g1_i1:316-1821(-)